MFFTFYENEPKKKKRTSSMLKVPSSAWKEVLIAFSEVKWSSYNAPRPKKRLDQSGRSTFGFSKLEHLGYVWNLNFEWGLYVIKFWFYQIWSPEKTSYSLLDLAKNRTSSIFHFLFKFSNICMQERAHDSISAKLHSRSYIVDITLWFLEPKSIFVHVLPCISLKTWIKKWYIELAA